MGNIKIIDRFCKSFHPLDIISLINKFINFGVIFFNKQFLSMIKWNHCISFNRNSDTRNLKVIHVVYYIHHQYYHHQNIHLHHHYQIIHLK